MAADALSQLSYTDDDDNTFTYVSHEPLSLERLQIYSAADKDVFKGKCFEVFRADSAAASQFFSVSCAAEDSPDKVSKEFIVKYSGSGAPEILTGMCGITAADVPHNELVEYRFEDPCSEWKLSQATREAMEGYIDFKFKHWLEKLRAPSCEAEFRRMLQNGLVHSMFDHALFPTPEELKSKYEVTDEKTGKQLKLPHPVAALRIWNPATKQYDAIDPRLGGAPSVADEASYWEGILNEFREKQGKEYIDSLLRGERVATGEGV